MRRTKRSSPVVGGHTSTYKQTQKRYLIWNLQQMELGRRDFPSTLKAHPLEHVRETHSRQGL